MPKYWFTKHFPHPKVCKIPWCIYLENNACSFQFTEGDMVVFYETQNGEPLRFPGDADYARAKNGRSAAIGVAKIATGQIDQMDPSRIPQFKSPPHVRFRCEVRCIEHQNGTEVPYETVKEIMKTGNPYIINDNVAEIDEETFDRFKQELVHLWPCKPTDL
jgi:hypothetical protein